MQFVDFRSHSRMVLSNEPERKTSSTGDIDKVTTLERNDWWDVRVEKSSSVSLFHFCTCPGKYRMYLLSCNERNLIVSTIDWRCRSIASWMSVIENIKLDMNRRFLSNCEWPCPMHLWIESSRRHTSYCSNSFELYAKRESAIKEKNRSSSYEPLRQS